MKRLVSAILAISSSGGSLLLAQQSFYVGSNVTGQLVLTGTVNALQQSQLAQSQAQAVFGSSVRWGAQAARADLGLPIDSKVQLHFKAPWVPMRIPMPPLPTGQSLPVRDMSSAGKAGPSMDRPPSPGSLIPDSFPVSGTSTFGFMGLTHLDDRDANSGNQFNIEPPSQGLAVGNGYILEGVNNAIQVYDMSGNPLLPVPISTNQLFGMAPAVIRATLVFGPDPTDIRAFYDQGINRFFVVQRVQPNDQFGNPLSQSEEIVAVSQTGDPTGNYNVYMIDSSDPSYFLCPCVSDYPQIGADQYAFYISASEYSTQTSDFVGRANILAISKTSLASGVASPRAVRFEINSSAGYEFAIQPATTPPGASNYLAAGGLEYFVSSLSSSADSHLALWAMVNTSSIVATNPTLTLIETIIPTEAYVSPGVATQESGPLPYGSALRPPGSLPTIDGGDLRVLSATYAGGRVYATLETEVQDDNLNSVVGVAYVVISTAYRGGTLSGSALRQGYVFTNTDHLLRPSIAINSNGNGAIVFTLVGPDYYPSAAFIPFAVPSPTPASPSPFVLGSAIQLAGVGAFPEDGFTGYPGPARWGDYSAAVVNGSDGSIVMGTEYIPNAPRVQNANWGTYLIRYAP